MAFGGLWEETDAQRRGKVLIAELPADDAASGNCQAQAVMAELQRLRELESCDHWGGCAVLARHHKMLEPVRAWCEQNNVPYYLASARNSSLPVTRQREFCALIDTLRAGFPETLSTVEDAVAQSKITSAKWLAFFQEATEQIGNEFGDHIPNNSTLIDWLYDYARSMRARPPDGLFLGTVHAAKGLEFRHVMLLSGGWKLSAESIEQERRLFYVGMTRAQQTLTLYRNSEHKSFTDDTGDNVIHKCISSAYDPLLATRYLSATDIC